MRRFALSALALMILAIGWTSAVRAAQPGDFQGPDLSLPVVAKHPGHVMFVSRVELFNASAYDMGVIVVYTPRGLEETSLQSLVTVPARTQLTVTEPLAEWFGFGPEDHGVGSLMFDVPPTADPMDLMVQSVVTGVRDDGSEFGQFFPAAREGLSAVAGPWAPMNAYLNTAVDPERSRVNVGLMALEDGTEIEVQPVRPVGTALAPAREFRLGIGGNWQINDVHAEFGLDPGLEDFMIKVSVLSGSMLCYASVLDGTTGGDYPGTSDPTTLGWLDWGSRITLLELGSTQGTNEFSGSLSVNSLDLWQDEVQVTAEFFPRDGGGQVYAETISVPGNGTIGYSDVVSQVFGLHDQVGTVVLTSRDGSLISATGREFAVFRDGPNQAITGTAGQRMAGLLDRDQCLPGYTYHLLGLRQDTEAGRERSHVAVFNPGNHPATVTVNMYDSASGAHEGESSFQIEVGSRRLAQVNSIIGTINPDHDGEPKRLEVTVDRPVFLRAFRVNRNGDPITIDPHREQ